MARSTYKTFLMYAATDDTYTKLIDIKDYPDLGGAPEMLETTTLSDPMQTNIPGIQSLDSLEFTANYTAEDFARLKEMEDEDLKLAVWFGGTEEGNVITPTGSEGKFSFTGRLSVYVAGGGVNEVTDMKITVAAGTPIAFEGAGA